MVAPINAAYWEERLSGGAGNTNPNASLGGVMSSERVMVQSASGITNITGITFLYAAGNNEGAGTLNYINGTKSFRWTPFGGAIGVAVSCSEDCRLALFGASGIGQFDIEVDFSALPGSDQVDTVTIANILNEEFDNITKPNSFDGHVDHRCVYYINMHPSESFLDAAFYIGQQPSPGIIAFGKDPAGVGNGSTTGVATTIANELAVPTGVTFSTASTPETGQTAGAVAPSQAIAVWKRRTVLPRNLVSNPETTYLVNTQLFY